MGHKISVYEGDILDNLTPSEVRTLIRSEDEKVIAKKLPTSVPYEVYIKVLEVLQRHSLYRFTVGCMGEEVFR